MNYKKHKKIKDKIEYKKNQKLRELFIKSIPNKPLDAESLERIKKNGLGMRSEIKDGFLHVFVGDVEGALNDGEIDPSDEDIDKEIKKLEDENDKL